MGEKIEAKSIIWDEIETLPNDADKQYEERLAYYMPFYKSLEHFFTEKIKAILPAIKKSVKFIRKYEKPDEHEIEVRISLGEEKCPYAKEGEVPYHFFELHIWRVWGNSYCFNIYDITHNLSVAFLDIEPYESCVL
ncbi:MAG: hypothetical protein QXQ64_06710 [Candidatus Bathyarchaeia archaeon]